MKKHNNMNVNSFFSPTDQIYSSVFGHIKKSVYLEFLIRHNPSSVANRYLHHFRETVRKSTMFPDEFKTLPQEITGIHIDIKNSISDLLYNSFNNFVVQDIIKETHSLSADFINKYKPTNEYLRLKNVSMRLMLASEALHLNLKWVDTSGDLVIYLLLTCFDALFQDNNIKNINDFIKLKRPKSSNLKKKIIEERNDLFAKVIKNKSNLDYNTFNEIFKEFEDYYNTNFGIKNGYKKAFSILPQLTLLKLFSSFSVCETADLDTDNKEFLLKNKFTYLYDMRNNFTHQGIGNVNFFNLKFQGGIHIRGWTNNRWNWPGIFFVSVIELVKSYIISEVNGNEIIVNDLILNEKRNIFSYFPNFKKSTIWESIDYLPKYIEQHENIKFSQNRTFSKNRKLFYLDASKIIISVVQPLILYLEEYPNFNNLILCIFMAVKFQGGLFEIKPEKYGIEWVISNSNNEKIIPNDILKTPITSFFVAGEDYKIVLLV